MRVQERGIVGQTYGKVLLTTLRILELVINPVMGSSVA